MSEVSSITWVDVSRYLGYLIAAWGSGWCVGYGHRIIKQFFEAAG